MRYIADLHIHSPYSRATSKKSHLHGLAAWAAIKGIHVVGTGDFTHPGWLGHILENIEEAEPGFFRLKDCSPESFRDVIPEGLEPDVRQIRFVLTSEISSIYKRNGRVRKIHNILFAPDLDSVRRINAALSAIGNLESDGRPILGLDSRNLLEILLEKAPDGFLIPAHIWTPWFSLFGSKSGFDTIEECFGDLTDHIFALETGLSSDPDMNRTISALDRYSLISNSDCHSPGKLGREANIFSTGFDYFSMREALQSPTDSKGRQRFTATIEFYPEEGKYHCDGHRKCKVCMEPPETKQHKGICPECGRPLTVGVLYRVNELADRLVPEYPAGSPAVHSLVPLPELLGELLQVGPASKKVMQAYIQLIRQFGSEFELLLDRDIKDIGKIASPLLAESVKRVRTGKVLRQPGYDGEFGVIRVFDEYERSQLGGQMNLFAGDTMAKKAPTKKQKDAVQAPSREKSQRKNTSSKKKELNPEQTKIVESKARHILVKAGPGTGKTHTLVQRLVRMASTRDTPFTVITFTNKSATELLERLNMLLEERHTIHVSTFHSYCLKWLRMFYPVLKVAGPDIRQRFLTSLGELQGFQSGRLSDRAITGFLQQAPDLRKPFPDDLEPYFSCLSEKKIIDIDAVIPSLASILYEKDNQADAVRRGTGALFIDEFQDLNMSQYEVVRLLAATSPVFAIGDPDQAVYGFRGSSPEWFYRFKEAMQPQTYSLSRNYRCTATIVQASNRLISVNRHPDTVEENTSCAAGKGKIYLYTAQDPRREAGHVVQQIERLIGGTTHREIDRLELTEQDIDLTLQDIAVLYRTSRQADILARALYEHGFPVQVVDLKPFYMKAPVIPVYLWILLASGRAESSHLLSLLQKESGIGKSALREIENRVEWSGGNVLEELAGCEYEFSGTVDQKIKEFVILSEQVKHCAADEGLIPTLQLLASRYELDDDDPELFRFYRLAENFGSSLDLFAQHLLFHGDSVVYDERAESLTLMTLHAAKGLEFKVVFIVGLEEGLLPVSFRATDAAADLNGHIEEERRIFYVGMTRAEKVLYLSHVRERKAGGEMIQQKPSRFLKEIPQEMVAPLVYHTDKRSPAMKGKQLSLFE